MSTVAKKELARRTPTPLLFAAGVLLGSIQFCHPVQKSPEKKTGNFSLVLKRCMYVGASAKIARVVATSDGSGYPCYGTVMV